MCRCSCFLSITEVRRSQPGSWSCNPCCLHFNFKYRPHRQSSLRYHYWQSRHQRTADFRNLSPEAVGCNYCCLRSKTLLLSWTIVTDALCWHAMFFRSCFCTTCRSRNIWIVQGLMMCRWSCCLRWTEDLCHHASWNHRLHHHRHRTHHHILHRHIHYLGSAW